MSSVGMDRRTGMRIYGFDHVAQSIGDILTTNLGERFLREWYGFPGFRLLGEPMNEQNLNLFRQYIYYALEPKQLNGLSVEPRFKVRSVIPLAADRQGHFQCRIIGDYLPRGHLGDFTVEGQKKILISNTDGVILTTVEVDNG